MTEPDVHGPIDTVILEFPKGAEGGATAQAILDLVDSGTIRLYDLIVVSKDDDGVCTEIEVTALPGASLAEFSVFEGARSGLVGEDDVTELAAIMDPGTVAAVIVYENAWSVPFVAAARSEGAELVASTRLTAQQIMDALDAVEAAD